MNCAVLAAAIRRALTRLRAEISVLWLYEPFHYPLVDRLGAEMTVFYVYDVLSDFPSNRRVAGVIRALDDALTRAADVVFVPSRAIHERRSQLNADTYLAANAVDFELFHQAAEASCAPSPALGHIRPPIAGFVGYLGPHIDAELLLYVSSQLPDWSLVLVGPDQLPRNGASKQLHEQANVHFLGQQPREALPAFLKGFDVGLMPYLLTANVLPAYPLKLHEYLAAGLPVVSTPLLILGDFRATVAVGDSPAAFVRAVRHAVASNDARQRAARIAIAAENTWDQRVEEIRTVLARRWAELHGSDSSAERRLSPRDEG